MEVVWSKLALITYMEIFENLQFQWSVKEMGNFRDLTQNLLDKIKNKQITCPYINENLGIRKAVIHKNVSLYYKVDDTAQRIYIITLFNNRMNPETLKKFLRD